MEIGISTASLFPHFYTEDCFVQIQAMGAEVCEVFLESYTEYSEAFRAVLAQKQTIRVHSVHTLTTQFEPQIISQSDRAVNDTLFWFEETLKTAHVLGAANYTFHGPASFKHKKPVFDFEFLAGRINRLIEKAAEYSVALCYENVHWCYFNEPEFFARLKALLPGLKTCLDIKQAMQSGYSYVEFFEVQKDRLHTIHLCDYDADGNLLLPGRGIFDFKEFFRRMAGEGIKAPCLLEVYSNSYRDIAEVKESFEFLRECKAAAGI